MGNHENQEQREYERFPYREDILIDGAKLCSSMDISEGGIYISAIQLFEKDSVLDVAIPFKGEKLIVKGKVQHVQQGIGMGIMFIDLNDDQKAAIKEIIESISNSSL